MSTLCRPEPHPRWGEGHPLHTPYLFGASILSPSALVHEICAVLIFIRKTLM